MKNRDIQNTKGRLSIKIIALFLLFIFIGASYISSAVETERQKQHGMQFNEISEKSEIEIGK